MLKLVEPAEIDVGRVVAGKYELLKLIGRGAMGEVWLARHDTLGGEFAVKLVRPGIGEDAEIAGRFQLEAQISAKLSRKTRHIVSVSDHGEDQGLAYLVMELLEGESLEARIDRVGSMDLREVVAISTQIARALWQAHAEAIVHRDLKPANVFLTKDEDGRLLVKLLDFGIARSKNIQTRSAFATGKDVVLGTPSYMSPEQARGLESLDYRCDIWALAVVTYEALANQIPWEGESVNDIFLSICLHRMTPLRTHRPDLPPAIEAVFARAFAEKLEDRFESAQDFAAALEAVAAAAHAPVGRNAAEPPSQPARHGAKMGSEPAGFTAGPTTPASGKGVGRAVMIVGALLLSLSVVGILVVSLRDRGAAGAQPPEPNTSMVTNVATTMTAPPTMPEATAPVASVMPLAPLAPLAPSPSAPESKAPRAPTGRIAQPRASAVAAASSGPPRPVAAAPMATAAQVAPATPATHVAPAAPPTPAPKKTPEKTEGTNEGKSGVF